MAHPVESVSSFKLAWAVAWSAFWTGFPFKLIVALLLLAGQVPPWEGAGLVTLLVVSVPIDMWAVGLTARTVFLERLAMEVQGPVGVSLWWQGTVLGALVLGAAYYAVGFTVAVGQQIAAAIIARLKTLYPELPIAEQITLDLLLWTIPAAIVLLACALVWLKLFGWRVKRFVMTSGQPSAAGFLERVRQWDYARVPADPTLVLVSFAGVIVTLTVVFWVLLPVSTPHPHPDYPLPETEQASKPVRPEELIKKTEATLEKAEAVLEALEKEKSKDAKKGKGK
jgi:hypothetical protein